MTAEEEKDEMKGSEAARRRIHPSPPKAKDDSINLGWKDYLAITIASFETIALPLVVLIAVLVLLILVLSRFR